MTLITKYQIFGERNSGTNYLQKVIDANFNLKFTKEYGFKHWYIKDHYPRGASNQTTDNECLTPLNNSDDTLFIFTIREPISWLQSMTRTPHHAYQHFNLSFSQFIRKEWLSYETKCPPEYLPGKGPITWRKDENQPYYLIEHERNICILRTLKIMHFLSLEKKVKNFWIIRQEHLKEDLEAMNKHFSLGKDNIDLPGYRNPIPADPVYYSDMKFIKNNLNLHLESGLGYDLGSYGNYKEIFLPIKNGGNFRS